MKLHFHPASTSSPTMGVLPTWKRVNEGFAASLRGKPFVSIAP
jgi:hypothetical protein